MPSDVLSVTVPLFTVSVPPSFTMPSDLLPVTVQLFTVSVPPLLTMPSLLPLTRQLLTLTVPPLLTTPSDMAPAMTRPTKVARTWRSIWKSLEVLPVIDIATARLLSSIVMVPAPAPLSSSCPVFKVMVAPLKSAAKVMVSEMPLAASVLAVAMACAATFPWRPAYRPGC